MVFCVSGRELGLRPRIRATAAPAVRQDLPLRHRAGILVRDTTHGHLRLAAGSELYLPDCARRRDLDVVRVPDSLHVSLVFIK